MLHVCMFAKSFQLYSTLHDPIDHSQLDSSVHGISQARIVEWVAMPSTGDLPDLGIKHTSLMSPTLSDVFFYRSYHLRSLQIKPLRFFFFFKKNFPLCLIFIMKQLIFSIFFFHHSSFYFFTWVVPKFFSLFFIFFSLCN